VTPPQAYSLESPLAGVTLTREQIMELALRDLEIPSWLVSYTQKAVDVPYVGERRIVSNRGVQETQAPLRCVAVTYSRGLMTFFYRSFRFVGWLVVWWYIRELAIACDGDTSQFPFLTLGLAAGYKWTSSMVPDAYATRDGDYYSFSPTEPAWYGSEGYFIYTGRHVPAAWCYQLCSLFFFCKFFWELAKFLWNSPVYKSVTFSYVPHIVSCVIQEFEGGADAQVVKSTTRSKIRRLATLPMPDFDHMTLISGSEKVIFFLVEKQHFFGGVAVSMRPLM